MKVEIRNLTKSFGRNLAVDDVSFSFEAGHVVGFVGPNGAGKTTTMRILSTLEQADSGDAYFDGVSVEEYPDKIRKWIGFMPDSLPPFTDMTTREYLDFFGRAYGLRGAELREAVAAVEDFTKLGGFRDKTLHQLSKGMKQRVSLARALIHDPQVMILDEPAAGLDPRARVELRELLGLLGKQGKAILISSHILTELSEICDRVAVIEQGRIVTTGRIEDIVNAASARRRVAIRTLGDGRRLANDLLTMPHVEDVRISGLEVHVDTTADDEQLCRLLHDLTHSDRHRILEFRHLRANLEDLFMSVTKGDLQ